MEFTLLLLLEKRSYCPKYVPAEQIKGYSQDETVWNYQRLPGEKEGIKFDLFAHKDPESIMILMSTYSAIYQNQQESVRSWIEEYRTVKKARFFWKELVANHYLYRGSVHDHKIWIFDRGANWGLSHEETWDTKHYENHVYAFIIASTELYSYLTLAQFHGNQEDVIRKDSSTGIDLQWIRSRNKSKANKSNVQLVQMFQTFSAIKSILFKIY